MLEITKLFKDLHPNVPQVGIDTGDLVFYNYKIRHSMMKLTLAYKIFWIQSRFSKLKPWLVKEFHQDQERRFGI